VTTSYVRGTETDLGTVKERFGGIDTPAALGGMFAMVGTLVFLGALITAGAGGLSYQLNAIDMDGNLQEIEVAGIVVASLVVLVAAFVGGWVAARIARFDGVINGVGMAIWLLFLVAVFAALGAFVGQEYNAFQRVGLPDWFAQLSADDVTSVAVVAAVVGIVMVFAGAALGGAIGDGYNRKVDAALTDQRVRAERNT
jgi:hypothetical protein